MRAFTCLVVALLAASCYGQQAVPPGPVEGVTFNTDPAVNRLEPGIYCVKDEVDSAFMTVDMTVFENDPAFQYSSPHPLAGSDIFIKECVFLNTTAYKVDNTQVHANPACMFGRVSGSGTTQSHAITSSLMWDSQQNVSLTTGDDLPCGGYTDDDITYEFIVQCSRDKDFHHFGDVTFHFCCDDTDALVRRQEGNATVLDGPIITVDDQYVVDFGAYKGLTGIDTSERIAITAPLYLGQPFFLEACLNINDDRPYFENNGQMPIGMYLFNCKATVIDAANQVQTGHLFTADLSDADGCATGNAPMADVPATTQLFNWFTTDNDTFTTLDYLISPNCFRTTRTIGATSFQAFNKGSTIPTRYECDVDYCFSSTDPKCFPFSEVAECETDENVLQCSTMCPLNDTLPPFIARKRRQIDDGGLPEDQFPRHLSVEITVINSIGPNDDNIISGPEERTEVDGCFEADAFIGLSVVIAVLVVLAMAVAMFLGMRLNQSPSGKRVSGSQDSNSGIQNKGYYN